MRPILTPNFDFFMRNRPHEALRMEDIPHAIAVMQRWAPDWAA